MNISQLLFQVIITAAVNFFFWVVLYRGVTRRDKLIEDLQDAVKELSEKELSSIRKDLNRAEAEFDRRLIGEVEQRRKLFDVVARQRDLTKLEGTVEEIRGDVTEIKTSAAGNSKLLEQISKNMKIIFGEQS